MEGNLLFDSEFFHIYCSTHILCLIVQEIIKGTLITCHKIRERFAYIKGSEGKMRNFEKCQEVSVDTSVHLGWVCPLDGTLHI